MLPFLVIEKIANSVTKKAVYEFVSSLTKTSLAELLGLKERCLGK